MKITDIKFDLIIGKPSPGDIEVKFELGSLKIDDPSLEKMVKKLNPFIPNDRYLNSSIFQTEKSETNLNKLIDLTLQVFKQSSNDQDKKTSVQLNILRQVFICSNFFFIKSLLKLCTRILKDMHDKKVKIIMSASNLEVQEIIVKGYNLLARINQEIKGQMQMHKQETSKSLKEKFVFKCKAISPKIMIDEYLLGEPVINPERLAYFEIDMGSFEAHTNFTNPKIESVPKDTLDYSMPLAPDHKFEKVHNMYGIYESLNFKMTEISVTQVNQKTCKCKDCKTCCVNGKCFLGKKCNASGCCCKPANFTVVDKFSFGLQVQSLISSSTDRMLDLPDTRINLLFKYLILQYDRVVTRQLFKIYAFIMNGTFLNTVKSLDQALSLPLPDLKLLTVTKSYSVPPPKGVTRQGTMNREGSVLSPTGSQKKRNALKDSVLYKFQKTEIAAEKGNDRLSVNLVFQGLEIIVLQNDDMRSNLVNYKKVCHLKAKKLKLVCIIEKDSLDVVALLDQLEIEDLLYPERYYKHILRLGDQKDTFKQLIRKQSISKADARKSTKDLQKSLLRAFKEEKENSPDFSIEFLEFDNDFCPFQDFLTESYQVCVHYCNLKHAEERQTRKVESGITIKVQKISLVVQFQLIINVMQTIFDVLYDLDNVEVLYKTHLEQVQNDRHLQESDRFQTKLFDVKEEMIQANFARSQTEKQKVNKKSQKFVNVVEDSRLLLVMPNICLLVPQSTEKQQLSLTVKTKFVLQTHSTDNFIVTFKASSEKKSKSDELSRIPQGSISKMSVNLQKLEMYLKNYKHQVVNLKSGRELLKKNFKNQIVSPFDFKFTNENKVANLRDCNIIQIKQFQSSLMQIETTGLFKLQFRIKQIRQYFSMICLILYHQNKVRDVKALPWTDDFLPVINKKYTLPKDAEKFLQTVVLPFIGESSKVVESSEIVEEADEEIMLLENLVQQFKQKDSQQAILKSDHNPNRNEFLKDNKFQVNKRKLEVKLGDFQVSILDDLTHQYEESLLSMLAKELKYELSGFDAKIIEENELQPINEFQLENYLPQLLEQLKVKDTRKTIKEQFGENKNSWDFVRDMYIDVLIDEQFVYGNMKLGFEIQVTYFNQKSVFEEFLIEPFPITYQTVQERPNSQNCIKITSKKIIDINLTYGCALSLYKAMQEIKNDDLRYLQEGNYSEKATDLIAFRITQNKKMMMSMQDHDSEIEEDESVSQNNSQMFSKDVSKIAEEIQFFKKKSLVEGLDEEEILRLSQMPMFNFFNNTGKVVTLKISNESYLSQNYKNNTNSKNRLEFEYPLKEGETLFAIPQDKKPKPEGLRLMQNISDLLKSYDIDQLKNAQLYLSFQIEGYEQIKDIIMNQFGIFGYRLKSCSVVRQGCCENLKTINCATRLIRTRDATEVYFESSTVIFNNNKNDYNLFAFDPNEQRSYSKSELTEKQRFAEIKSNTVMVIPLIWFEQNLQIQIVEVKKQESFKPIWEHVLFSNGSILSVLNPEITDPYFEHNREMKIGDDWLGLEFAFLHTRTSHGQFLMLLQPLIEFHNLMFSKLTIEANRKEFKLESNIKERIADLNPNHQDFSITVKLHSKKKIFYEGQILNSDVKKMSENNTLNYKEGTIITLVFNDPEPGNTKVKQSKVQNVSMVFEKTKGNSLLPDTSYNNFGLRQKIYHHQASHVYEFYNPLVAINETPHLITIQDSVFEKEANNPKNLKQQMNQNKRTFVNMKNKCKSGLYVKIEGYEISAPIDLRNLGIWGSIQMKKLGTEQDRQTIEIGTSLKLCDEPFTKTRIVRFTQKFVIYNKLPFPIVIREKDNFKEEFLLQPQAYFNANFRLDNTQRLLQCRMALPEEIEAPKQQKGNFDTQSQVYSFSFSNKNIDDFQIKLPEPKNKLIASMQAAFTNKLSPQKIKQEKDLRWNDVENARIVRVTITNDKDQTQKMYTIISQATRPDYLFLNYLNSEVIVSLKPLVSDIFNLNLPQQKLVESKSLSVVQPCKDSTPGAVPLVLNPMTNRKKNVLMIQVKSKDNKKVMVTFNYAIDDFEHTSDGCSIKTRVSGQMRIIELYRIGDALFDSKKDMDVPRKEQKRNLIEKLKSDVLAKNYQPEDELTEKLSLTRYQIELAGIGFSIVDFKPSELSYISFKLLVVDFQTCSIKQGQQLQNHYYDFHMILQNFQIDAMQNEAYPVLFGPKEPFRQIEKAHFKIQQQQEEGKNEVQARKDSQKAIFQIDFESKSLTDHRLQEDTIEKLSLNLQELELKLHISLIKEINDCVQAIQSLISDRSKLMQSGIFKSIEQIGKLLDHDKGAETFEQDSSKQKQIQMEKIKTQSEEASQNIELEQDYQPIDNICRDMKFSNHLTDLSDLRCRKIHIKWLVISTIKVNMTLRIRGIEGILQKSGPINYIINLSSNFADITDAEFTFSSLEFIDVQEREVSFIKHLKDHYKEEAIQQFYQVFGSQDIIGNPSSFITNIGRGAVEIQTLEINTVEGAAFGFLNGIKGLVQNTALAVSNSYCGISGSVYLGLKNLSGMKKTHQDLDRPLTFGGGLKKGFIGLGLELLDGVTSIVKVPQKRLQTQGIGFPQLSKGVMQGALNCSFSALNAPLRFSYCIATGIKNELKQVKDYGQRARYPRYFDLNDRMYAYDADKSQAQSGLKHTKDGKYKNEVIETVYEVSVQKGDQFIDRVLIITNESVMFIEKARSLKQRVVLHQIKGMMLYFYDKRHKSIILELTDGKIVRMTTNNAEINQKFLVDLKQKLEQLEKQQNKNKDAKKEQQKKTTHSDTEMLQTQQDKLLRQNSAAVFMLNNKFNYNDEEEPQDGVPLHDSLYTDESYWSGESHSSSDSEA